jgi:hypothetical protein
MSSFSLLSFFSLSTRRLKMEVITAVAAWAIAGACRSAPAASWLGGLCPRGIDVTALTAALSAGAVVYFPGSEGYTEATTRWSVLDAPTISMVVVPSVESDVAETVSSTKRQWAMI